MGKDMPVTGMVAGWTGGLGGLPAVVSRDCSDQSIDQLVGCRRTEAGCSIPAWAGIEACHCHIFDDRVIATGDVMEGMAA